MENSLTILHNLPNPLSDEEAKKPSGLLFSLKDFELVIVFRFLPARDKLLSLALLNKRGHSLVKKHYSWSRLPSLGPRSLISDCFHFLRSFSEFTKIHVCEYPCQILD